MSENCVKSPSDVLWGSCVPQYPLVVQRGAFLYWNNTVLGLFATSLGQQIQAAWLRGFIHGNRSIHELDLLGVKVCFYAEALRCCRVKTFRLSSALLQTWSNAMLVTEAPFPIHCLVQEQNRICISSSAFCGFLFLLKSQLQNSYCNNGYKLFPL